MTDYISNELNGIKKSLKRHVQFEIESGNEAFCTKVLEKSRIDMTYSLKDGGMSIYIMEGNGYPCGMDFYIEKTDLEDLISATLKDINKCLFGKGKDCEDERAEALNILKRKLGSSLARVEKQINRKTRRIK